MISVSHLVEQGYEVVVAAIGVKKQSDAIDWDHSDSIA